MNSKQTEEIKCNHDDLGRLISMVCDQFDAGLAGRNEFIEKTISCWKESLSLSAPQPVSEDVEDGHIDDNLANWALKKLKQVGKQYGCHKSKGRTISFMDGLVVGYKSGYAASLVSGDVEVMAMKIYPVEMDSITFTNGDIISYDYNDGLREAFKAGYAAKSNKGCACINVDFGSYDNQIEVVPPLHMAAYKAKQGGAPTICIDACLVQEVHSLWKAGITTTGCCCGHNKGQAFIGVIDEDIPRMKEMGYQVAYNPSRPNDEDSFIPKSIK